MDIDLTPERRAARQHLGRLGVKVLFEDNHLLCVAKPAGLLSQGGPPGEDALPDLLDGYRQWAEGKPGRAYVGLVHRLDRNVSGAMVVAKTSKAAGRLSAAFRDRVPELRKTYLAWVERVPRDATATLIHRLRREGGVTRLAAEGDTDGRDARLAYEMEGRSARGARLRVTLATGLPHQIRAQLAHVGHPLFGDTKYGGPDAKRVALHAFELEFPHPVGGGEVAIRAPVPKDLKKLDARLRMEPPV
jgi:23S rRNA pseudouridine1911/1915/1917 synthase